MQNIKWLIISLLMCFHLFAQPEHTHLLYEHSLMQEENDIFSAFSNNGGVFIADSGWQAITVASQLSITLPEPLPLEGTMLIDVSNFDPVSQNAFEIKQQIVNMYSHVYTNNKDIFETDGSWWNIRTGSYYSDGEGLAGFKFLAASRGIDTRGEIRLLQSNTWDVTATHQFKIIWSTENIYIFMDDVQLATLPFSGQVEPFRHILIGKDNLIYGYAGQPGPVYSNLKIYSNAPSLVQEEHPVVTKVVASQVQKVRIRFDRPVTAKSATLTSHYEIDRTNTVLSAIMLDNNHQVELDLLYPLGEGDHSFKVMNIKSQQDTTQILTSYSTTFPYYQNFAISNISKTNYRIATRAQGDSVYVDRDYRITNMPSDLTLFPWIMTANDDKAATGLDFITFDINMDATLWVGMDETMIALPSWMQDWQKTAFYIETSDTHYNLYVKYFTAGQVMLGGNYGDQSASMYLITVIPHNQSGPDINKPDPPTNLNVTTPELW